jgi:hypothetical protein
MYVFLSMVPPYDVTCNSNASKSMPGLSGIPTCSAETTASDDELARPTELSGALISPATDPSDEWAFPREIERPLERKPIDHSLPLDASAFPTPIRFNGASSPFPGYKTYTDYHEALHERSRVYKLDLSNQNMRWGNLCDIGSLSHLEEIDLSGSLRLATSAPSLVRAMASASLRCSCSGASKPGWHHNRAELACRQPPR